MYCIRYVIYKMLFMREVRVVCSPGPLFKRTCSKINEKLGFKLKCVISKIYVNCMIYATIVMAALRVTLIFIFVQYNYLNNFTYFIFISNYVSTSIEGTKNTNNKCQILPWSMAL